MDTREAIKAVREVFQSFFPLRLIDGRLAWLADRKAYEATLAVGHKEIDREEAVLEWIQ
jgi:hypothetical protein